MNIRAGKIIFWTEFWYRVGKKRGPGVDFVEGGWTLKEVLDQYEKSGKSPAPLLEFCPAHYDIL